MISEEKRFFTLKLDKESLFVSLKRKDDNYHIDCPVKDYKTTKTNVLRTTIPYKWQTSYEKYQDKSVELTVIVMENNYLRAEFLPSFGARLIRLFDKKKQKDLVFYNKNPQLSNIALSNAWFAGGIEFNIGSLGHHRDTSRKIAYEYIEDILHFENFARKERLFYTLDFQLIDNVLALEVNIENLNDDKAELYWWTNIAVEENIIDCSSKKALLREGKAVTKGFKEFDLNENKKYLNPKKLKESVEYFIDCSKDKIMWESVKLDRKNSFYEIGTNDLKFRKLFCWGTHQGGRQWNEFLVGKNNSYIEIQAGLAPTQMHTSVIDKKVNFKQVFTPSFKDGVRVLKDFKTSYVSEIELPFLALDNFAHKKSKKKVIDKKTKYFYDIVSNKKASIPEEDDIEFTTDPVFLPYLDKQNNYYSSMLSGIIYFDNEDYDKALEYFKKSESQKKTVLIYHLLAECDKTNRKKYYEKAMALEGKENIYPFYAKVLIDEKEIDKLDLLFKDYKIATDLDAIRYIQYLELKGKKDELNFLLLNRKWVNIEEGETILSDIYKRVNNTNKVPYQIDFRQFLED